MTARPPGLIDESGECEIPKVVILSREPDALPPANQSPTAPMVLDLGEDHPSSRVDHDWQPAAIQPTPAGTNSISWLAAGLTLLLFGWMGIAASAFIYDQFARSTAFGAATTLVLICALGLILRGLLSEIHAYRGLRRVETLRMYLSQSENGLSDAKRNSLAWLESISDKISNVQSVVTAIDAAQSVAELKVTLHSRVIVTLRESGRQMARKGAIQGGALVAVVPAPALDGLFVGLRGLALVQQIARLYGLRPGFAVTLSLVRRVAGAAAEVSGVDLIAQSAVDHLVNGLPIVKHFAGAMPGTSIAAFRLYRLGIVTAEACSPVHDKMTDS